MTFTVGKNQVHIGWWETFLIIGAIISCTWGVAWFVISLNNREDKRDEKLNHIYESVRHIEKHDTLTEQHFFAIDTAIAGIRARQSADEHIQYGHFNGGFATQLKDRRGKIHWQPSSSN